MIINAMMKEDDDDDDDEDEDDGDDTDPTGARPRAAFRSLDM